MAYSKKEREQFVAIFKSNATDVSRACKAFKIGRKTFYEWMKNDSDFADMIDEAREEMKDFGESQLYTLMKGIPKLDEQNRIIGWVSRPDTAAIIFYNKTRNKDRGYDERSIIKREGTWPSDITINVQTPEQAEEIKKFLQQPDAKPE